MKERDRASSSSEFVPEKKLGKREKIICEFNLVDRISELPHEILVSILSLLPLREAAATSILSRRWHHLWLSTMSLDFDVNHHLGRNRLRFEDIEVKLQDLEISRYVDWVNHVVEQHKGPVIERFRACFELDGRFTSSIDKWIQFTMAKGVQILELNFFVYCYSIKGYTLNPKLLGLGKENLYSSGPSLHSSGGFKFLKALHFQHVNVTEDVLEYFLSNCPLLERLAVQHDQSLVNIRVVGSSIALKHLTVKYCTELQSIEICDANLVSFIHEGFTVNLRLSNVPLLVAVSISAQLESLALPFTQLSCCLPQLETLLLDISKVVGYQKHAFPVFENLKHLELIVKADHRRSPCYLTYFLKAFPCLQRLVVMLDYGKSEEGLGKVKKASACPHQYIKVVEIVGYRARKSYVKLVMNLMKSLVALEKIVIDPVHRFDFDRRGCPSEIDRGVEVAIEEEKGRDHAMQYLRREVPSAEESSMISPANL